MLHVGTSIFFSLLQIVLFPEIDACLRCHYEMITFSIVMYYTMGYMSIDSAILFICDSTILLLWWWYATNGWPYMMMYCYHMYFCCWWMMMLYFPTTMYDVEVLEMTLDAYWYPEPWLVNSKVPSKVLQSEPIEDSLLIVSIWCKLASLSNWGKPWGKVSLNLFHTLRTSLHLLCYHFDINLEV